MLAQATTLSVRAAAGLLLGELALNLGNLAVDSNAMTIMPRMLAAPAGKRRVTFQFDGQLLESSVQFGKPVRRQLGVPDCVLNVFMSEVFLDQSRIGASIGQVVTAGVPEHVRMDRQRVEFRSLCILLDQKPHGSA
jgi:hypothetical protein